MTKANIDFKDPVVSILHMTPLAVAEVAARVCYDSFDKSNNEDMQNYSIGGKLPVIENSDLLEDLSHVYFHGSVAEHVTVSFHIKGVSRGCLHEIVRHRMSNISVRSTRYTMSNLLIAAVIAYRFKTPAFFVNKVIELDTLITVGEVEIFEANNIFASLNNHFDKNGLDSILELTMTKTQIKMFKDVNDVNDVDMDEIYNILTKCKSKRNVGDNFKYIVSDNFSTELVFTLNLRSLSNFMKLRNSDSAYFQIHHLANEILSQIPDGYRDIITKKK